MAYAEATVVIDRPVGELFQFILAGENHKYWRPTIKEIYPLTAPPVGVGSRFRQVIKTPTGMEINVDYQIAECELDRLIGIEVLNGPYLATGKFRFEPNGDGEQTQVTFTMAESTASEDPARTAHLKNVVQAIENLKGYFAGRSRHSGD